MAVLYSFSQENNFFLLLHSKKNKRIKDFQSKYSFNAIYRQSKESSEGTRTKPLVYFPLCYYSNIRCVVCTSSICHYLSLFSFVVCYLSTAHVFCATKKKNALPKVRLGHAFARLVSRSFVLLLWYCAIFLVATPTKKHCGSYDQLIV